MATFSKSFSRAISQAEQQLGTVWLECPTRRTNPSHFTSTSVFTSGRDRHMAGRVLSIINEAQQFVVVVSFLLADEEIVQALLDAACRGVRVYLGISAEAQLNKIVKDGDEFTADVVEKHRQMLRRLEGYVLVRSASHFHAKVVIADPDTKPDGFLLTSNLTREALERNEECGVALNPDEVREVFGLLRWALWESAEHDNLEGEKMRAVKPLGVVGAPSASPRSIFATAADIRSIREEALRLIGSAKASIIASSFGWGTDHPVVERLCERARQGIQVTVLCRYRPTSMDALVRLRLAGATVLGFQWLHAKAILVDGELGMVMSANLEAHGLDGGFELGVPMHGDRARELGRLLDLWRDSAPRSLEMNATLGTAKGSFLRLNGRQFEESRPMELTTFDAGIVTAPSAELLPETLPSPQKFDEARKKNPLAKEIEVSWKVHAPEMPKHAKIAPDKGSQEKKGGPNLYAIGSQRVIGVASEAQLPEAVLMKAATKASAIMVLAAQVRA